MAPKMSAAMEAKMKAQARREKEQEAKAKIRNDTANLAAIELVKKKAREAAAIEAEKQAALAAFKEGERLKEEKERKTKRFFDINAYNRRITPNDAPVYYGDFNASKGLKTKAWIPHGHGQFLLNDEVKIDGEYVNGVLTGVGTINWVDGISWHGDIVNNMMHGGGVVTFPSGTQKEAMAYENRIEFFKDELVCGKQVEFQA